ncbi:SDR family NAD(P)-dependent oxidoreductase [Amycolatopsis acidiphila]|uniref:SDR family NAD(P)-dependent oxidoreductase n=1 Tax=Amycolatopsis acidiphila TaxID=715473 RepID=A0A557ZQ61_9PSEU|nr:type I polyketide synthase [Amycolatopsis acidiphila]TVT14130.1 SDR family NAD(P)-dependent oxidoreductase [Amycolatopsis acidiphila]UIJ59135.1 SDR family NAD(P)-dependent oxidoreductase [Amycolatopsis acidiphila]GHG99569.1 polyketide synthase [Amycolatopsis acidiphila]
MTGIDHVAVVGISCRFANADGPDEYWRLLRDGVDVVREIPGDRFPIDSYFDPDPDAEGRTYSRWGGFLDDLAGFDAAFFGISPREADRMDPQQRHLLEVAWNALNDAGIAPGTIEGTRTGVFVGGIAVNYADLASKLPDLNVYAVTGTARSVLAGRLSFALDARGPSIPVDTACSSSLVALHLAYRSVRDGESELAIAGGTNVVLLPDEGIAYSRGRMLARDGRCKFADASGDGFVRSEGIGVVVLKPVSRAVADGDRIYAVIMGSATNSDGKSSGYLLTPSCDGQVAMMRAALADAGLEARQLDYVEAHGTGTSVGDAVELRALAEVLGTARPSDRPCLVGSSKTNIGHTEGAAGIAGLIKTALSLRHRQIPASLHMNEPNAAIDWDDARLAVPTFTRPWPHAGRAIAGVSAFGIAGSNAHVIVAEPDTPQPAQLPAAGSLVLPISAADPVALRVLTGDYARLLRDSDPADVPGICAAAAQRRDHYAYRIAATGHDAESLAQALLNTPQPSHAVDEAPKIAFVFPGQGSQWPGMGRDLLDSEPVFRDALRDCAAAIAEHTSWSLLDVLAGDESDALSNLDVVQPTLWAMQVSLAALWRSWGVEPDVVIGHSMGEVAAAHVAGALDLADAARIICLRSRLAQQLSGTGAMAVLGLPPSEVAPLLDGQLAIAAYNSPNTTVISGPADEVQAVVHKVTDNGQFAHLVRVDFASHSPLMDPIREQLLETLDGIAPRPAGVRFHSTVHSGELDGTTMDANYWADNLRQPVLFADAIATEARQCRIFLEISPHPVLTDAITDCGAARTTSSLTRGEPGQATLHARLAQLYEDGATIDWRGVLGRRAPHHDLPCYPWQHKPYWLPDTPVADIAKATGSPGYLVEHRVQGTSILPGMVTVDLALQAAHRELGNPFELSDIRFHAPLTLTDIPPRLRTELEDGKFSVHGQDTDGTWITLTTGKVQPATTYPPPALDLEAWSARCTAQLNVDAFYAEHQAQGNDWGPSFQRITELRGNDSEMLAMLDLPSHLRNDADAHLFHPALLDACGQVAAASVRGPFVGESIERVRWYGSPGPSVIAHLDGRHDDGMSFGGNLVIASPQGEPLMEITGLRSRLLNGKPRVEENDWLHEVRWRPLSAARIRRGRRAPRWLVVGDDPTICDRLPGAVDTELGATTDDLGVIFTTGGEHSCRDLVQLVKSLVAREGATRLWIVTRGSQSVLESDSVPTPEAATLWGLLRTISVEHPALGATAVDLPEQPTEADLRALTDELALPAGEYQVALRGGRRFAARLVASSPRPAAARQPGEDQVLIAVTTASDDPGLWSCVGIVTDVGPGVRTFARGDQVLALGASRTGSSALAEAALTVPMPRAFTPAEAVTLMHAYVPVLHGLRDLARLGANETVLVHPATGPQAAAAIHVARMLGATAMAERAGIAEERALLDWAGIPEPSDRPDVVLTTTSAPVPDGGRCVQIGGQAPTPLPPNASYHRVDVSALSVRQLSGLVHEVVLLAHRGDFPPLPFRQHGASRITVGIDRREPAYVITGGLGDLGVVAADLLIERGARRLVLIGRSSVPSHRVATLDRWRGNGIDVEYHALDIADEPALRALLEQPIRGVIHAAGIGTHTPVTDLSAEEIQEVLHPKLRGAAALHCVLADRPLEFFVLFSSAAAVLPSPLLGAYAAANSWLDALALHRCAHGLPTLSIGWGFWETGMAVRLNGPGQLRVPAGLASFTPARGAAMLGQLLDHGVTGHVVVTPADWAAYASAYSDLSTQCVLTELAMPTTQEVFVPHARTAPTVEHAPSGAEGVPPGGTLEDSDRIGELVANVLRLVPENIDRRRPLNKLGMDSLMATEIRTCIKNEYGVDIPMLTLLKGASIDDVAAALAHCRT